ncbi:MAG: diphthine--ammonia ligase [Bacteroidota bacterium]
MSNQFLCSWSGGKDSCFALMKAKRQGYQPVVLLNVLNEAGKISRSHGIPSAILQSQAEAMNMPVHLISSSWQDYEAKFTAALVELKEKFSLQSAVFGDIDLQPHRDWEEKVCNTAGLDAILPLWQQDRRSLVMEMLEAKIETMIVSCNAAMGAGFLGKTLTPELIDELEAIGVDACGENGEFHTLVLNCPLFTHKIEVDITDKINHEGYWFTGLALAGSNAKAGLSI